MSRPNGVGHHSLGLRQLRDPAAAGELWSRIDHELVDRAPWVPLYNLRTVTALRAGRQLQVPPFLERAAGSTLGSLKARFAVETRFLDHFSAALAEIIEARIWAGLHFRNADVQSVGLGENVACYMVENFFQPVGNH